MGGKVFFLSQWLDHQQQKQTKKGGSVQKGEISFPYQSEFYA